MVKVDAEKIMEEILGMKAGLNPDQQVSQTIITDALCCHNMMFLMLTSSGCCMLPIMNAEFCHIMMLHVALGKDLKKAVKRDSG